ncbi:MAG TPA: phosphodiester glycosidase family protein [Pyrinomonadaceae bacterium]|nr:phosphodiester glycosidase family protein [Pyrinomonadaceae bacterium]
MPLITHNRNRTTILLIFALALVFAKAVPAQEYREVHPGVEYAQVSRIIDGKNVNFNLLRLDLKKVRLDVVHAMDAAIGTETTSSLARRHNAVAAINAGFFRLDNSIFAGDNVGYLTIDGYVWSEPTMERGAIGIINRRKKTEVFLDRWRFAGYLRLKSGDRPDVLMGLNREINGDEVVAYTPAFGTLAPRTGDVRLVIRKGRVVGECLDTCEIPKNGFVLVGNGARSNILKQLKTGDRVQTVWDIVSKNNAYPAYRIEDAVAGVPLLIRDGKIDITWKEEGASKSFVETQHPRTAVANLKDGKFLMLTADGRSEASGGIDLYDLADFLLQLGAVDALNLDGGGSTTMVLDDKVVNHPSDKGGERKIGDALIVTLRK